MFVRRVGRSNSSSKGVKVIFTNGDELIVSSSDKEFAELVLAKGKIVENVGERMFVAMKINESNFLPIGECHFFSPCGGIEYLPGLSMDMFKYILFSGTSISVVVDGRFQKEKRIDPKIIGL